MNKKTLQIQTNFLADDDPHSPIVTTSKINYQGKLDAATVFEKSLSIILAKNFISCWKELKTYQPTAKIIKQYSNLNINKRSHNTKLTNFPQKTHHNGNARTQSQRRLIKSGLSQSQDEYRRSHRSVRVISQEIENSRANILQQIVEKLKNARKIDNIISEPQSLKNGEVLRKINHLQKMVRTLTSSKHKQQQDQKFIEKIEQKNNQTSTFVVENIKSKAVEIKNNEEEIVKSFMHEIQKIRCEIKEIKLNNEAILKNELERSRASSNSCQNLSKNMEIKQALSEAVKTPPISNQEKPLEVKALYQKNQQRKSIDTKEISKPQILEEVRPFQKSSPINVVLGMSFQTQPTHHFNGPTSAVEPVNSSVAKSVAQTNYQNVSYPNQSLTNQIPIIPVSQSVLFSQQKNEPLVWRPLPHQPQQHPFYAQNPIPQPLGQYPQSIQPVHQIKLQSQQSVGRLPVTFTQSNPMQGMDPVKTNTTFYSKNNIYSDASSSSTLGPVTLNLQTGHFRNPSIQYHETLGNGYVKLANYCSHCRRNCECARVYM